MPVCVLSQGTFVNSMSAGSLIPPNIKRRSSATRSNGCCSALSRIDLLPSLWGGCCATLGFSRSTKTASLVYFSGLEGLREPRKKQAARAEQVKRVEPEGRLAAGEV